jgi:uncharacterized protein YggT (Ycf19 family)
MTIIDFILNIVGLLLWLSWRSAKFDPLVKTSPASLAGALRRAEPNRLRGWHYLGALAGLLLIRGCLYWQIGPAVDWVPNLELGAISLFFRSDRLARMMLFSGLSFGLTLVVFYLWLLFLSLLNSRRAESDPVQRMIRLHLGWIDKWPWPVKLLLPLVTVSVVWLALNPVLSETNLIQPGLSSGHKLEQAVVIGLGAYLAWEYLIGGLLLLGLVSTYVYLGNNSFWSFISLTGDNLMIPLRWARIRVGKIDLAPIVAITALFLLGQIARRGLTTLYARLPL